jgi:hypothetical protein
MSTEEDKVKHSKRLHKEESAIKRQTKIAKAHGAPVTEPHKFAKHHAMNCGNPDCTLCANPRKTFGEKTPKELRDEQDTDTIRDRHSNGLPPDEHQDS